MKRILSLIISIVFSLTLSAQTSKESRVRNRDSLKEVHKKTIYYLLQNSWEANEEPSYLSLFPFFEPIGERRLELIDGEGEKSNFPYLLEANMNLTFPLFFGKYSSGNQTNKRHRITLDYNVTFRMTNDTSRPLTPGSNKIGFSWYFNLYNNYTGWIGSKNQTETNQKLNIDKGNLKFWNFLTKVHHYSNGQAPGFYYYDPNDSNNYRNDYIGGDFSTNYVYIEMTRGIFNNSKGALHQISLGSRFDLGKDTPESTFVYSKEQEGTYGRNRLFLKYDYRGNIGGGSFEQHVRFESSYISDYLDNFIPNLKDNENKYRFSVKGMYELAPLNHRAIGYYFSAYYGRDYLNIRYDDIIYSFQLGITLSLNKFFIPKYEID